MRRRFELGTAPASVVVTTGAALVGLVTLVDYETPADIRLYALYFLPVSFVSWYTRRTWGVVLSLLATVGWTASNQFGATHASHWLVVATNFVLIAASFLIVSLLISGRRTQFERERELARSDALTGLANRRAFEDMLRLEVARARRYVHPLTVVYLDLDGFKKINDDLGHHVGDELLRDVSVTLRTAVRATDIVARLGGDEFAVMLPETPAAPSREVVERLRATVAARMEARGWAVTVSAGAVSCEQSPPDFEVLVARADALMYEAKRAGKNATRFEVIEAGAVIEPRRESAADPKPN